MALSPSPISMGAMRGAQASAIQRSDALLASATRSNPVVCMRRAASTPRQGLMQFRKPLPALLVRFQQGVHSLQGGDARCDSLEAEQIGRDHAPDQDV